MKENVGDTFAKVQFRLDTNLQIAIRRYFHQFDVYEMYKPGIGSNIVIRKIGLFMKYTLRYTREESFYESRKNLSKVLLRTGNKVKNKHKELFSVLIVLILCLFQIG